MAKSSAKNEAKTTKSVKTPKPKTVLEHKGLAALQPPKNTGDACVAFDVKQVRTAVTAVTESLAFARDATTDSGDILVMLSYEVEDTCVVVFARSGGASRYKIPCRVFKRGRDRALVVPMSLFRAVTGEFVTLTLAEADNAIKFSSGRVHGSVQLASTPDDYSTNFPYEVPAADYTLPASTVDGIVTKLMFPSFDPTLPLLGLPLHILVKKNRLQLSSNDNLAGALYALDDVDLGKLDVVIPGQALLKVTKLSKATEIKLGFGADVFRMKTPEIDIVHPTGTYDLLDMRGFIADSEKAKPDFELELETVELITAIDSVMSVSALDRGEGKITLDFSPEGTGLATFQGNVANAKQKFRVQKITVKSKSMNIITDGRRLTSFITMLKLYKTFRLRVANNRAFMSAPDNSLVFMLPLA